MGKCEQCIVRELSSLKALSKDELIHLAHCKEGYSIKKGDVIFHEGDTMNGVYCIKEGTCKLVKMNSNGKDTILKLITKGDLLGQTSILTESKASLSAVAVEDMQVCFIPKTELMSFIDTNKNFSFEGCQTVYDLFSDNGLSNYYDFEKNPGAIPKDVISKYNYLDNTDIVDNLLDFKEESTEIVRLYIPHIHCSSCIWILENLNTLNTAITHSQVVFSQKKVSITYNSQKITLKQLVLLLASIGYEPYISLEQYSEKSKLIDRSLLYKIGVAFFGFGNIMLLSFPEYFNVDDFWMLQYRDFFRYFNILLALPVFLYSATPYYKSAYYSLKTKAYNIDIPMALGIIVMFVRSLVDIFLQDGAGFLDSMCGLVFFMLSGKLIQQTTYNFLSFERDYKSYFPIAVTKIDQQKEVPVQVYEVEKGNQLLIRNEELIPVDAILLSDTAFIDYSFVTGEAVPVEKKSGDKIFAGGK